MKEKFIEKMINDFDHLIHVPRKSYDLVVPNLKLVYRQRGEIIKRAGETDFLSRYICEGFVGYYNMTTIGKSLFAIFQPTDIVFDLDSYRSGSPSLNELKAISQVTYLEFSVETENELVIRDPNLMRLALLVNQRITHRQAKVHEISKMGFEEGYLSLLKEFKGLGTILANRDLASFFHVSLRTVERMKPKIG
jgi:hypothetical protein